MSFTWKLNLSPIQSNEHPPEIHTWKNRFFLFALPSFTFVNSLARLEYDKLYHCSHRVSALAYSLLQVVRKIGEHAHHGILVAIKSQL